MQISTNDLQKELKEHGNSQFPVLVSNENIHSYESGYFRWHWHPEIEITLVTKGKMIYKVNNKTYTLNQNDILFCNSSALHYGVLIEKNECFYTSVTFDPKVIYGFENSIIYNKYVKPILINSNISSICFTNNNQSYAKFFELLNSIHKSYFNKSEGYELELITKLQEIWQLIYFESKTINLPEQNFEKTDLRDFERIRTIISFIESNYQNKITLDDISEQIHLCKNECCRMFKRFMNQSIFDYLINFRIEKGAELLRTTNLSVSQVALEVGFNDSNHFSKMFHKLKGVSPKKY